MRSSKKKTKPALIFDYYGNAVYGLHPLFVKATEFAFYWLKENKAEVGYYSFLSQSLDDLDIIASMAQAEGVGGLIGVMFPLGGVTFIRNEVSGQAFDLTPGKRDVVYKFTKITKHPVYVMNIVYLSNELIKSYPVSITVLYSYDVSEALNFLQVYYELRRAKARECQGILDAQGSILSSFRTMSWDKLYLEDQKKAEIQNELNSFFKSKDTYHKNGLEWRRGILLAGPPGCGKTSVCRAIATTSMELKIPVIYCECDIELFAMLNQLHSTMVQHAPCVVILEDVDAFHEENPTRPTFLNLLDGLFSCEGTFFVATTNGPEKLDSSLTGRPSRLDSYYVLTQPSPDQRRKILSAKLPPIPKSEMDKLVDETDGLSFAFIQEIAVCALLESIRTKSKVTLKMIKDALAKVRTHSKASKDGIEGALRGHAGFSDNENQKR